MNSESNHAVRAIVSVRQMSYGSYGSKRNKMCLARNIQFGTDLLNVAKREVFRAVGVRGYLIITLLLLVPEE